MDQQLEQVFLSIGNATLSAGQLPTALPLLKYGDNPTDRGVLKVTDRTIAALKAQREGGVFDRVLIDFEHNSLEESPTYQPPPRHHAGAGLVACSVESGLCLEGVTWTPKGVEYALNYPDISPSVLLDKITHEVVGLKSVGLVPNGGVIGLSFFSVQTQTEPEGVAMPDLKEITDSIAAIKKTLEDLQKKVDAMSPAEPSAEVTALGAKVPAIETAVETLKADVLALFAQRDKQDVLTHAAFSGKVVNLTDDAIAKLSVVDLKAHVEAIEPTVPLHRRTFSALRPDATNEGSIMEQYNAITDPAKRAAFWTANRGKLLGTK